MQMVFTRCNPMKSAEGETVLDVAVYPQRQTLFFSIKASQQQTASVHSSALDGTSPMVLDTLPSSPVGLAIDTTSNKLYYADTLGTQSSLIEMNLDGTGRRVVYEGPDYRFTDATIDNGKLYWTQAIHLYGAELPDFTNPQPIVRALGLSGQAGNVFDVAMVNATVPPGRSGCEEHDCEALCFGLSPTQHRLQISTLRGDPCDLSDPCSDLTYRYLRYLGGVNANFKSSE
eukprot:sb/3469463/